MGVLVFVGVASLVVVLIIVNKLAIKNAEYKESFLKNKEECSGNCEVCECADSKS